jgi:hypothetical protein
MRKTIGIVALAALAGAAWAGPTGPTAPNAPSRRAAAPKPPVFNPADANFSDNFDGYANGSAIIGQGGWAGWDVPNGSYPVGFPPTAFADNAQSASAPNSARGTAFPSGNFSVTDMVHPLSAGGTGKWKIKCKVYVPSNSTGEGYFIINNQYDALTPPGTVNWSVQVHFNPITMLVTSDFNNPLPPLPLIVDQWVEVVCDVDLTVLPNGKCDITYGGQPLHMGRDWIGVVSTPTGALLDIQNVNLYANNTDAIYYDDFSMTQVVSCYPDCNGDGQLNLSDFGCFQTAFALGQPYADCNGDGVRNLSDFGCFQTKFALGCP